MPQVGMHRDGMHQDIHRKFCPALRLMPLIFIIPARVAIAGIVIVCVVPF